MSIRTFNGQWLLEGNSVATDEACCCPSTCGEDCQQIVTIDWSVDVADGQLVYVVADEFLNEVFETAEYYIDVYSFISCSVVDGFVQWTLLFEVCYFNSVNEISISEGYEGFIEADSNGCPKTGNVTMNPLFGAGESTVTASIA